MGKTVIIIGAGFGGLSAAALLAKAGFEVLVLEKNKTPGGRAMAFEQDGFSFDMGPSWYLMPEVFENFFKKFGKSPSDFYQLKKLNPYYRAFFGKRDFVDITPNLKDNIKLFDSIEKGAGKMLKIYLTQAKYKYELSMNRFIYKDYKNIFDFFRPKLILEARQLHVFESLEKFSKRFFISERLRQLLQYSIVFLGGSPKNTPSIYSLMSHIDFNLGVFYPIGGIFAVVKALETLAKEKGAKFKYGVEVKKIIVKNDKIKNVKTNKGNFSADIILANADYHFVETKLLEKKFRTYPQKYWDQKTIAPSAFILYLGISKKIKALSHHNLFLANNWIDHFNQIFEKPNWPNSPSYYICAPSKTDPKVAPKGMENLFVLVPVAPGLKDDDKTREKYSQKILTDIEQTLGENLKESIVVKRIFSQRDYKNLYHAFKGTALGLSHTLMQTALFRPSHKSKKVKNLYFTGQYTTPGIGVPMTIISSQIAVKLITDDQS